VGKRRVRLNNGLQKSISTRTFENFIFAEFAAVVVHFSSSYYELFEFCISGFIIAAIVAKLLHFTCSALRSNRPNDK
jgi:hypothetical protein